MPATSLTVTARPAIGLEQAGHRRRQAQRIHRIGEIANIEGAQPGDVTVESHFSSFVMNSQSHRAETRRPMPLFWRICAHLTNAKARTLAAGLPAGHGVLGKAALPVNVLRNEVVMGADMAVGGRIEALQAFAALDDAGRFQKQSTHGDNGLVRGA